MTNMMEQSCRYAHVDIVIYIISFKPDILIAKLSAARGGVPVTVPRCFIEDRYNCELYNVFFFFRWNDLGCVSELYLGAISGFFLLICNL